MDKILLVQTAFLGDVVLSTPVIERLRDLYPQAELHVVTTPAAVGLLSLDKRINKIHAFDKRREHAGVFGLLKFAQFLRKEDFTTVYALQRSYRTALVLKLARIPKRIGFKSAALSFLYTETRTRVSSGEKPIHEVERNLSIFSQKELESLSPQKRKHIPGLTLTGKELKNCNPLLQEFCASHKKFILLAPGSAWATKRWPAAHYGALALKYKEEGYAVAVVGGKEEQALGEGLAKKYELTSFCGILDLTETITAVKAATLLVSNDSMIVHVASSQQTPTVVIFGPTSAQFGFGPWRNKAISLERSGLTCQPCSRHGTKICPLSHHDCMVQLTPDQVFSATQEVLHEK